jgi:type IV secretion system protein VirD4
VLSTAQSHTHFLDSPRMARVLDRSTVDLGALKRAPGTSVYLVLPSDRLDGYARWLRLVIACALLAVQRERGRSRHRVLFLLDEFAHLGRMQPVLRDVGLAGGYGLSFWLVVQDLSQLRSAYGDAAWPTFLANADVLQAFGTNDWDTAEYLSKMTGEATIRVASENASRGVSRGGRHAPQRQQGAALTMAEKGRRLLLPDEVRRLPSAAQLLFVKGSAPHLVERVDYRTDPVLAGRADPNPLYRPIDTDAVAHDVGARPRMLG